MIQPRITIVGAGPGDIELITVKGLQAIKQADVILYDALVNEELLTYAPVAKHIFVGKRKGYKAMEQDEINRLLVDSAQLYGRAVRLKGGDPFVFGRGGEEWKHATLHGIPTEVIPGISSAIGVPAMAGYSVTYREIATSFTVVSGTKSNGSYNEEINRLATLNGTLIILMGLGKLEQIAAAFSAAGKETIAAAVILNGTLPDELVLEAPLNQLPELYKKQEVSGPGIILIGSVVSERQKTSRVRNSVNVSSYAAF